MNTMLVIACGSSSEASTHASEASGGSLWGVDLGTTTLSTTKGEDVALRCTQTRAIKLMAASPSGVKLSLIDDTPKYEHLDVQSRAIYFSGVLGI